MKHEAEPQVMKLKISFLLLLLIVNINNDIVGRDGKDKDKERGKREERRRKREAVMVGESETWEGKCGFFYSNCKLLTQKEKRGEVYDDTFGVNDTQPPIFFDVFFITFKERERLELKFCFVRM